jgi:hypothetical protein
MCIVNPNAGLIYSLWLELMRCSGMVWAPLLLNPYGQFKLSSEVYPRRLTSYEAIGSFLVYVCKSIMSTPLKTCTYNSSWILVLLTDTHTALTKHEMIRWMMCIIALRPQIRNLPMLEYMFTKVLNIHEVFHHHEMNSAHHIRPVCRLPCTQTCGMCCIRCSGSFWTWTWLSVRWFRDESTFAGLLWLVMSWLCIINKLFRGLVILLCPKAFILSV